MTPNPTLAALNAMTRVEFVSALAALFELAPWIVEEAWEGRPFARLDDLRAHLMAIVAGAGRARQVALLCTLPEPGGRAVRVGAVSPLVAAEQAAAGLDRLSDDDARRFDALNAAYRQRFGFPCVIATRGHDKGSVLAAVERRLNNDVDAELAVALAELDRIVAHRLAALVTESA